MEGLPALEFKVYFKSFYFLNIRVVLGRLLPFDFAQDKASFHSHDALVRAGSQNPFPFKT